VAHAHNAAAQVVIILLIWGAIMAINLGHGFRRHGA
jgi:hypothetical protein